MIRLLGSGMVGIPAFSKSLFEALALEKINVVLITQSSSEHSICVRIDEVNSYKAKIVVDNVFKYEIGHGLLEPLSVERDLSIVTLVGNNMQNHIGVSGRMFSTLGKIGINIRAIAQRASKRNISAVINTAVVNKAVNVYHEEFFKSRLKEVNLFIAGTGNVSKHLIHQLLTQQKYLKNHLRLNVRIVALTKSKKMLFLENGISTGRQEGMDSSIKINLNYLWILFGRRFIETAYF